DVCVVTVGRLILDVRGVDGDATRLFFGRIVNLVISLSLRPAGFRQDLGDRCGQRSLAMVNVTDGADVAVRLIAGKLFLAHRFSPYSLALRPTLSFSLLF